MQNTLDKSPDFDVDLSGVYLRVFTGPRTYELLRGYHGGLITYTFYSLCVYMTIDGQIKALALAI